MPFWLSEILWRIWDKTDIAVFLAFYLLGCWGANHNSFWATEIGTCAIMITYLHNRSGN